MKKFICIVAAACATLFSAVARPNFVVILADDLGYNDLGFQGSKDIKSPNLDSLAKGGMTFTNGYVCHPYCGPSRTGFMTGRYPHRFGCQTNLYFNPYDDGVGVPTDQTYLSEVLKANGYTTGVIGKWHLGSAEKYTPNKRGFDYFFGFLGGGHSYLIDTYPKMRKVMYDMRDKRHADAMSYYVPLLKNDKPVQETGYLTDVLSREAVSFIQRNKNKEFFLYLAYNAPHTPLQAKSEDIAKFSNIKDKDRQIYAAMIYSMDEGIGKVVAELKKQGIYDNTVIIFMSDNGGATRWHQDTMYCDNSPLRGHKGMVFEGGYRVPYLVHWNGKIKNVKSDEIISSLDVYPTLLGFAGISDGPTNLDGLDVSNFLLGKQKGTNRNGVFVESGQSAARVGDWKIILGPMRKNGSPQNKMLFNLKSDIAETTDLSNEYPDKVKSLEDIYNSWAKNNIKRKYLEVGRYFSTHKDINQDIMTRLYEENLDNK